MPSTRSGRSTSVKSKAQTPVKKAPAKKAAAKKAAVKKEPVKKSKSPAPPKKKAVAKARAKSPGRKAPRRKTPPPAKKAKAVKVEPVPHVEEETPSFTVNEILDTRKTGRVVEYLVSWVGYPPEDNTWETASDLKMDGHAAAINKFTAARKKSEKAAKAAAAAAAAAQEESSSEEEEVPASTHQTPDASVDSVNSVGSFMFYWTVMVCTIVTYTMIQILLNGTGDLVSVHPSRDDNKWAAFLSQASPWVAILPPFISVVVLISHPGSTAPFPKYVSVALVWISTHNFLEHFAKMELHSHEGENIEGSLTILLTLTSMIAYIFLANGFAGPRGDNRHPAPGHVGWGAMWFLLWTWEFTNRMEKGMLHESIKIAKADITTFPQTVWNMDDFTTQATILLKIPELVALYYAVYKASACIGHGCGPYSSAAVPQHIGVVAMLFIVFANMFPIIFDGTDHAWFMDYAPKVLNWLGGALLTTVGLWDADTFNQ